MRRPKGALRFTDPAGDAAAAAHAMIGKQERRHGALFADADANADAHSTLSASPVGTGGRMGAVRAMGASHVQVTPPPPRPPTVAPGSATAAAAAAKKLPNGLTIVLRTPCAAPQARADAIGAVRALDRGAGTCRADTPASREEPLSPPQGVRTPDGGQPASRASSSPPGHASGAPTDRCDPLQLECDEELGHFDSPRIGTAPVSLERGVRRLLPRGARDGAAQSQARTRAHAAGRYSEREVLPPAPMPGKQQCYQSEVAARLAALEGRACAAEVRYEHLLRSQLTAPALADLRKAFLLKGRIKQFEHDFKKAHGRKAALADVPKDINELFNEWGLLKQRLESSSYASPSAGGPLSAQRPPAPSNQSAYAVQQAQARTSASSRQLSSPQRHGASQQSAAVALSPSRTSPASACASAHMSTGSPAREVGPAGCALPSDAAAAGKSILKRNGSVRRRMRVHFGEGVKEGEAIADLPLPPTHEQELPLKCAASRQPHAGSSRAAHGLLGTFYVAGETRDGPSSTSAGAQHWRRAKELPESSPPLQQQQQQQQLAPSLRLQQPVASSPCSPQVQPRTSIGVAVGVPLADELPPLPSISAAEESPALQWPVANDEQLPGSGTTGVPSQACGDAAVVATPVNTPGEEEAPATARVPEMAAGSDPGAGEDGAELVRAQAPSGADACEQGDTPDESGTDCRHQSERAGACDAEVIASRGVACSERRSAEEDSTTADARAHRRAPAEHARDSSSVAGALGEEGNDASAPAYISQREATKPSPGTLRRVAHAPLRSKRKRGPPTAWWIGSGRDTLAQETGGATHDRDKRARLNHSAGHGKGADADMTPPPTEAGRTRTPSPTNSDMGVRRRAKAEGQTRRVRRAGEVRQARRGSDRGCGSGSDTDGSSDSQSGLESGDSDSDIRDYTPSAARGRAHSGAQGRAARAAARR